jgi:putative transposase
MAKVPASEHTRNALKRMLANVDGSLDLSGLVRQSVRLMVEQALEAEATERLGRGYYEHGEPGPNGLSRAHRNGYRMGKLSSAEGAIEYAVPQVRGIDGWTSEIRAALAGKTEELARLAVEMYARGLSVRDIEAAFTDRRGRCVLSRSAASRVSEAVWTEYQAFAQRDLSDIDLAYLFVDGIHERLHLGQPREAVLAAWGITTAGHKVLLGLQPGDLRGHHVLRGLPARLKGAPAGRSDPDRNRRRSRADPRGRRSAASQPAAALSGTQVEKSRTEGAPGALA